MSLPPLPVDEVVSDVIAALRANTCAVLRAPTGAGKTTRVPPALLDAGLTNGRQIIVIEPRRIAARAAARRIAEERGVRLGGEIGYHVRFDRCASRDTRLIVATPGIVLQHLHADPYLDRAGLIVFDEFHERGLDSDLALGFMRLVQQTVRPELRLLAMSATLASERVARYLGGCPVVASEGRLHPVDIRHIPKPTTMSPAAAMASAVKRLTSETPGDILVFLPGWAEIRQLQRELAEWSAAHSVAVLPLHGDLSPTEQDAALRRGDGRRVVVATNVAETSVTVDGVTGVVDSGQARELIFDPAVGLDRLSVVPISKAAADQRAGRAGRTQPGVCLRLWSQAEHAGRPDHTVPELRRVDLAGAVLQLAAHGETEPAKFPWFDPPPEAHICHAQEILRLLGAIDERGAATEIGRQLALLPVHPRLGRMLLAGAASGAADRVALAAAILAERDPFRRLSTRGRAPSESDVLDRVEAIETFAANGTFETPLGELDRGAARYVLRAADQLRRAVENEPVTMQMPRDEAVMRSLVAAFPDRVCRRRNPGGRKGVMVGGRGVRLDDRSAVTRSAFFLAVDIDAGAGESIVRIASSVEREWLPAEQIVNSTDAGFDEASGRLCAWKRTRYGDLLIEEAPTAPPEGEEARAALAAAAMARLDRILPSADSPAGKFRIRVRCLRAWRPDFGLPALDDADLKEIIHWLSSSCRSLEDYRRADWHSAFRSRLDYRQQQLVEGEAPERLALPSGRSAAVAYEEGKPPVLAAKIQDLFGLRVTPQIAGGTVAVLLHLLAPNGRPQQVTTDLASFWKNTYPVVRKELRGRYPKHQWPEDPLAQ